MYCRICGSCCSHSHASCDPAATAAPHTAAAALCLLTSMPLTLLPCALCPMACPCPCLQLAMEVAACLPDEMLVQEGALRMHNMLAPLLVLQPPPTQVRGRGQSRDQGCVRGFRRIMDHSTRCTTCWRRCRCCSRHPRRGYRHVAGRMGAWGILMTHSMLSRIYASLHF